MINDLKVIFFIILDLNNLNLVSNCYSQSSSSSSSSLECPEHYSGPSCSVFQPYIWHYNAAPPSGSGWVTFFADFGSDTTGLQIKIGDQICALSWSSSTNGRVECGVGPLNLYELYDVEVSNSNGVILFLEDFYSPYINDCGYGSFYMGHCQCYFGYEGQLCDAEMQPYITSITSSSVDGGLIRGEGWFGSNAGTSQLLLNFFIDNKELRIVSITSNSFTGYAPQGTGSQDVTIYDASNNQLLFTGPNLFSYDPNMCFNDCFNNGVCNNGVCTCHYPWVGDFCSHTKDTSCQCSYI